MSWDRGLVGAALDIARTQNNPLRVMAGPGTGKSFALKRRVHRILESGADPKRLLVVTFTRTAASDLVKELRSLGVKGCDEIFAGTLHSYCFSVLQKNEVLEYLDRHPRPLVTIKKAGLLHFEAGPLLADLRASGDFGAGRACNKRIWAFEAAWARLQSDFPGWPSDSVDREFHRRLLDWLKFHKGMMIGEVVIQTLNYLKNNPGSEELKAFDHIIVDEYQDLNKAEQSLIDLLSHKGTLAVVGDEDQSIYGFRYAHPEGISTFKEMRPNTYDASLDQCRRCPTTVVELANSLILNNHDQEITCRLKPHPDKGPGEVHIVQWDSIEDEIVGIAEFVTSLVRERKFEPKDILILSPRRLTGYAIRDQLVQKGIAVHSFYHEEALESDEAQEAFCLLTLLARPEDRVALRYWLGSGSKAWRTGQYGKLQEYCTENGIEPFRCLEQVQNGAISLSGIGQILKRFEEMNKKLNELKAISGKALFDSLFPEKETWAQPLREAVSSKIEKNETETAEDLLELFVSIVTQPEMPEEGNFVRVMSLHKSKGLTSRAVVVANCVEGLIPRSSDESLTPQENSNSLKEQRRLFYVALTRTTEILLVTSFRKIERSSAWQYQVKIRGGTRTHANTVTSQFIAELGKDAPSAREGRSWSENGFK